MLVFPAPTCLVSSLWFSCGVAVSICVYGGSCKIKTSPFRRFRSRLLCRFAWQAWHFVTFQPVLYRVESSCVRLAQQCALHFTLHTPNSTLYTPTPHSTLHTQPHSTLHTPRSSLYTPHSTLYTFHSTLHTLHFTLHTPQLTF